MLLITCFIFGLLGSLTWAGPPVKPKGRSICPFGTYATREQSQWYCHKFYEEQLSFQQAEEECQYNWRGGHLASITSDAHAKRVNAYVSKENQEGEQVWIGLQWSTDSSRWEWTDGLRGMKYSGWSSCEAKNKTEDGFCSALIPQTEQMKWSNVPCNHKLPFVCKWKAF